MARTGVRTIRSLADIDPDQILINDGAWPRDPDDTGSPGSATAVHKMGEVWALALFEGRARLIDRLGFTAGNERMLQIVMNGMKVTPLQPDFIDARDAILAAAAAMDGSDLIDLWRGFATRGMGVDASTDGVHVVESFDTPGITANATPVDRRALQRERRGRSRRAGRSACRCATRWRPPSAMSACA